MQFKVQKSTSFILGSLILLLSLVAVTMYRLRETDEPITYGSTEAIVATNDPLITQQITERDLLPEDSPLITILDPSIGNENAAVTIVEFSDFECPYCKDIRNILAQILTKYPNDVRLIWKDAPATSLHRNALDAHIAARCAQEQNAFWEYHDELFNQQSRLNDALYNQIARDITLNLSSFTKCRDGVSAKAKVERSITEAEVLRIDATPYLFINGNRVNGELTFDKIDQMIRNGLQ